MKLPHFSIATKLYAVFALLATVTVALAIVAVLNARRHAALTGEFESAFAGALNVERVKALFDAIEMDSRGMTMSPDAAGAKAFAVGLIRSNDRIGDVVTEWQWVVRPDEAAQFQAFSDRIKQFQEARRELVRRGAAGGPAAAREWADSAANRDLRAALSKDLEAFNQLYSHRSKRINAEIDSGIEATAWLLSVIAGLAVLLAAAGAIMIWRSVAQPLARITRITEAVAAGATQRAVPYRERGDEVGALARSISVFQDAMRKNEELSRTIIDDAQSRATRQERMSAEISQFSADVEATVSALGRISDDMLAASTRLAGAADNAATRSGHRLGRCFNQCARHCLRRRRACRLGDRDRPAGRAVERHRRQGGERGRVDQRRCQGAQRGGRPHRRRGQAHHRHRRADQPAGAQRHHRGGARGRCRPRLRGGGERGQGARRPDRQGDRGYRRADLGHAACGRSRRSGRSNVPSARSAISAARSPPRSPSRAPPTQEIARSVETAAKRTIETASEVERVGEATTATRDNAGAVKAVADDLGQVAARIRGQVDAFFQKLRAA